MAVLQSKVGLTGIEHVKGTYDPNTQLLASGGCKKDDPDNVISLEKYRLIFSDNAKVIGGITWNNGNWRGLVSFTRSK